MSALRGHGALGLRTEINLTPLIDVLLVLLVIVLLISTMFVRQLPVTLPVSDVAGVPVVTRAVQLSLSHKGELLYGYSPITSEALSKMVNPEVVIELSIDRNVRYESIANTVSELQKLQPKSISLVTR